MSKYEVTLMESKSNVYKLSGDELTIKKDIVTLVYHSPSGHDQRFTIPLWNVAYIKEES